MTDFQKLLKNYKEEVIEEMSFSLPNGEHVEYQVALYRDKNDEVIFKKFTSSEANYIFRFSDGLMISWGKSMMDDPGRFPAPNIADIEETGCCTGPHNVGDVCKFCYKSNTPTSGTYMTFKEFRHILDVYPKSLTQIALGADACLVCNPDIWKIIVYCRYNHIVPNITLANVINDEIANKLAKYCGAVAVSAYDDLEITYNSVKKLTDRGMTQVNIHLLLAENYYERAKKIMNDVLIDPRLEGLNAVVCLGLKKKGRGTSFERMTDEHFKEIVDFAVKNNIKLGFDSCNSKRALDVLGEEVEDSVIACEASLESSYISYKGDYYPCSFMEGEEKWKTGISLKDVNSPQEFIEKVWNHEKTLNFMQELLETTKHNCHNCRECPYYEV